MNIQLPDPQSFSGAVLSGWTVTQTGGSETMTGTVIVKAAYDVADTGGPSRMMSRVNSPQRCAIVFQDSGTIVKDDQGTADPADDEVIGFNVTREADIALQKARADIVIKGWGEAGAEGEINVDGINWFTRASTAAAAGYADVTTNLFGWHSRTESPRKIDTPASFKPDFDPPVIDTLPPQFGPAFNNVYRRSAGFGAIAAAQAKSLPSAKTVVITKKKNSAVQTYRLELPNLAMKARLRAWCGDCPDKPERWCIKGMIALTPDTLIVDPVVHQAEIIWRGLFDWNGPDGQPVAWRVAQVMEGVV
jgi:hypothetical protein